MSKIRQPIGFGGREVRTYDEMDSRKVVSLSIMVYVKRQHINLGVGRYIPVNFWFKNGALTDVSTNSLEIKIKKELLDQSIAALKENP